MNEVTTMKNIGTMKIAATAISTVWSMNACSTRWRLVACGIARMGDLDGAAVPGGRGGDAHLNIPPW